MSSDVRWLVRTRLSGVWVDVEWLGEGDLPGEYRISGRRLHSWEGGALACGDLARVGPDRGTVEARSEPRIFREDLAERHVMSEAALERVRALPDWRPT